MAKAFDVYAARGVIWAHPALTFFDVRARITALRWRRRTSTGSNGRRQVHGSSSRRRHPETANAEPAEVFDRR